jgi:hypothetical protein
LPITDNLSGVDAVLATFTNDSSDPPVVRMAAGGRVSGTALAGVWETTWNVPAGAAAGTWTVSEITVGDRVGHRPTFASGNPDWLPAQGP